MKIIKTKNIFILLYILYLFICQVLCEGECNCDSISSEVDCKNCNPNCLYYSTGSGNICIYCQDLQTKPYYKISNNGEIYSCSTRKNKDESDTSIILKFGTKEIIDSAACTSTSVIIEDICYTTTDLSNINADSGTENKCASGKFKYITKKDGFTYINCVDECPSAYKYYNDQRECTNDCDYSENMIKREIKADGNSIIIRCSQNCIIEPTDGQNREFIYKYKENPTSQEIKYCVEECPNDAKYYYSSGDNKYTCLKNCNEGHFSEGFLCKEECNTYITVNLKKNIYDCLVGVTGCPPEYPYLYESDKNFCLKSCRDTQDEYFGNEPAYLDDDDETKKCISEKVGYKIDTIAFKWVENCQISSSGPYIDGNKCVDSCQNKYKSDTLECISECGDGYTKYIEGSNACYTECPSNLGKSFTSSTEQNKCQSCNVPDGTSENEVGFYKSGQGDRICYHTLDAVGSEYYHNVGDNICSSTPCSDRNLYKYQPFGSNVCYKSCEDIKSLGYKYEKNYMCFKEENKPEQEELFIYESSSGIIKYTSNEKDCLEAGYQYYDSNKKCVKRCVSTSVYRKLPTNDNLGICFASSTDIPNGCNYYNKTSKICSDECEFLKITDEAYIDENKENCVVQCPDSLYEKDGECVSTCNDIIIEESNKIKCAQNCDKFLHEIGSQKYCVDKCQKTVEDGEGHNTIQYLNYIIDSDGKKI